MSRASRRRAAALPFGALVLGALACLALAAPGALAQGPAVDQYELDIPKATGAGADHEGNKQDDGGTQAPADDVPAAGSGSNSTTVASTGGEPAPPSSGGGGGDEPKKEHVKTGSGNDDPSPLDRSAHTVPAIAVDTAGDGGISWLLAGLAAVGALAGFVVYRRRRAHA